MVLFLPAAVYALCAGCAPFKQCYTGFPLSYSFVDDTEATLEQVKVCVDLFWLPSNFGSHACWFSLRNPKFDCPCRQKTLSMIVFMKCLSALLKFLQELIRTVTLRCWNIVLRITPSLWILYDKFCINPSSLIFFQVSPLQSHQGVRLPRQLRDQLLQEMETYILGSLVDKEIEKSPISDIFFRCALFSNFIYGSCFTRFVSSSDTGQELEWALIPILI